VDVLVSLKKLPPVPWQRAAVVVQDGIDPARASVFGLIVTGERSMGTTSGGIVDDPRMPSLRV